MRKILIYILSIALLLSCSKDDEKAPTSGETTLSSRIFQADVNPYVEGFSFEEGKKVSYNLTASPIPDIIIDKSIDLQGAISGASLASPKNDEAFYKLGEFNSLSEAEAFFNSLKDIGTGVFSPSVKQIAVNQVYIFKSRSNKYAKILIKDIQIKPDVSLGYADVTFKWVYQPNGEKTFPE